jgi:hypothetical protein
MTEQQEQQFFRVLDRYADARESLHMAGSAPTVTEQQLIVEQAQRAMQRYRQQLFRLVNTIAASTVYP